MQLPQDRLVGVALSLTSATGCTSTILLARAPALTAPATSARSAAATRTAARSSAASWPGDLILLAELGDLRGVELGLVTKRHVRDAQHIVRGRDRDRHI